MTNTPTEPGLYWVKINYQNGESWVTVVDLADGLIQFIGDECEEDPARMNGEFLSKAEPPWAADGAMCPGFTDPCANPALCAERGCVRQR